MATCETITSNHGKNGRFTVHLFKRNGKFIAAEHYFTADSERYHQGMGLTIVNNTVDEYDGVFYIPRHVASALKQHGISTPEICLIPQ